MRKNNKYPSSLVTLKLLCQKQNGEHFELPFTIPKNEIFRIKDVVEDRCYEISQKYKPRSNSIIVDIGANVGCFALYSKMINPAATIYCFEPVPATIELLNKNTTLFTNIHIQPIALSNKSGKGWIDLHPKSTGENRLLNNLSRKTAYNNKIEIQVLNADDAFNNLNIEHIDILKIDTEGSEVQILESIRKRLHDIDYILLEFHSENDRRLIDTILDNFVLFSCAVHNCGIGLLKYVNKNIIQ